MTLVVIVMGGALGALSRFAMGSWVQGMAGSAFPWGTWAVNAIGSLALGFAMIWLTHTLASGELRHFVVMGFLGSFTTFSTFSFETVEMLQDGLWLRAGFYALGSVAVGILAVVAGAAAATAIFRATA